MTSWPEDDLGDQGDLFDGFPSAQPPPAPRRPEPGPATPSPRPAPGRPPTDPGPRRKPAQPRAERNPDPTGSPRGERSGQVVGPDVPPLAERMRPRTLDELAGQQDVVGPNTLLRRLFEQRQPLSLVFWGPPGSGKTTLARILATRWGLPWRPLSAVTSGIQDARQVFKEAQAVLRETGQRTVVFVDEIHRFNKTQQDAFLPYVEAGAIVLLGATTENPSFSVVGPLLSRCRVLTLSPLRPDELRDLLVRALHDPERGLGSHPARVDEEAWDTLVWGSGGDARRSLNALEAAVEGAEEGHVTRGLILEALGRPYQAYERGGETAFNLLSAFHKSLRGSDPDAAVYWLVRIIEAGEDPLVPARRMVAMAAEDVGCADPHALPLALAALQAFQVMGSPEGDLALTEAAVYLACAPKSNAAARALWKAREKVKEHGGLPVPLHLRNAVTPLMKRLGYGRDYRYPHDFPGGRIEQQYLPDALKDERFYEPGDRDEATLRQVPPKDDRQDSPDPGRESR